MRLLATCGVIAVLSSSLIASEESPKFVVVVDITKLDESNDPFGNPKKRMLSFENTARYKALYDGLLADAPLDDVMKLAGELGAGLETRWISKQGDRLAVFVFADPKNLRGVAVHFEEKNRLTRLSKDIVTAIELAGAIAGRPQAIEANEPVNSRLFYYPLKRRRAELTIQTAIRQMNEIPATNTEPLTPKVEASKPDQMPSVTLITGPREALFLSADVPLNHASQLKLNDAKNGVELKDEPGTFYVGVDYTFGDILSEPSGFWDRVVLKGLIKASKQPWDSIGWAIAVRSLEIPFLGIQLDLITPFAGYTYTRQDEVPVTGQKPRRRRNSERRFGVSLNLDSALSWVKKEKK